MRKEIKHKRMGTVERKKEDITEGNITPPKKNDERDQTMEAASSILP
jgi:hypothetical protein